MRVKSEARRQAILDVAAEVFREHGFEHASMSEMTTRLGGSKSTLYSYFASKEELFLEVMHQFAMEHMQGVFDVMDPAEDIRSTLQRFGEHLLEFISSERMSAVLRMLYSEASRADVGRQFYERGHMEGVRRMAAYVEQCSALGKLLPCDGQVAARHFCALLKAEMMDQLLMGAATKQELPPIPEATARAVSVFLRAYS